jgi:hypothetical protein
LSPVAVSVPQGQRDVAPLRLLERVGRMGPRRVQRLLQPWQVQSGQPEVEGEKIETRRSERFCRFPRCRRGHQHMAGRAQDLLNPSAPRDVRDQAQGVERRHPLR